MTRTGDTGTAAIHALLEAYVAAHDRRDAAALATLYAPDAWVADLAPPLLRRGRPAAGMQGWFDSKSGPIRVAFHDLQMQVDGGICLVQTLRHTHAPHPDDPDDSDWWSRLSLVLRRGNDGWRIVHEHESVPYYMDGSFRAAVDLTPDPLPADPE